jgi:hypothetical protein
VKSKNLIRPCLQIAHCEAWENTVSCTFRELFARAKGLFLLLGNPVGAIFWQLYPPSRCNLLFSYVLALRVIDISAILR